MTRAICAGLVAITISGCAHTRLSNHSVKQASTISDLQQQQVLENLALIYSNPGALPHFATPNGGGTRISDTATVGTTLTWNVTTLTGVSGNASGNTNLQENWTLNPVNDPTKLDLIRCVLLYVTGQIDCNSTDPYCTDCVAKLTLFFKEDWATCDLPSPGFFRVLDAVPCEDDCCVAWAEECGTVVAVDRCNHAQLTKLTLAILDIATIAPDQLSARMNPSAPKVKVNETYLANVNGQLRLVEGEYTLSETEYKSLEANGIKTSEAVRVLIQALSQGSQGISEDDINRIIPPSVERNFQIQSAPGLQQQGTRRETGNSLESLINLNGGT